MNALDRKWFILKSTSIKGFQPIQIQKLQKDTFSKIALIIDVLKRSTSKPIFSTVVRVVILANKH